MTLALNVLISATLISFSAWLSRTSPVAAGFLVAMPVATLIVLPLAYLQNEDPGNAITLARSIFLAIPVSLLFFLPFLLSDRLGLSFWQAYAVGCAILPVGFFAHRSVTGWV